MFLCALQKIWFGILFFIPTMNWKVQTKCILVILIYFHGQITSQLANPARINLIADLVPENIRGTYFGKKDSISVFVTYVTVFFAGILFDHTNKNNINAGFQIFGSILILLAIIDAVAIAFIKEPENLTVAQKERVYLWKEIIDAFKHKGFQEALILNGIWTAAVYFTVPFNASYQIKELGLSYTYITAIGLATMLLRAYLMPRLGKVVDKIGNETMLIHLFSIMGFHYVVMMFTVPENGKVFFVIASLLSAIAHGFISQGLLGIQLKVLDERKRTIQYSILSAASGTIGFAVSVVAARLLEMLQSMELAVGTRKLYAQQFMNLLGLIFILINIGYLLMRVDKAKTGCI